MSKHRREDGPDAPGATQYLLKARRYADRVLTTGEALKNGPDIVDHIEAGLRANLQSALQEVGAIPMSAPYSEIRVTWEARIEVHAVPKPEGLTDEMWKILVNTHADAMRMLFEADPNAPITMSVG